MPNSKKDPFPKQKETVSVPTKKEIHRRGPYVEGPHKTANHRINALNTAGKKKKPK